MATKFKFKVWQRVKVINGFLTEECLVLQRPDHYYNILLDQHGIRETLEEWISTPNNLIYRLQNIDGKVIMATEKNIVPCGNMTDAIFGW